MKTICLFPRYQRVERYSVPIKSQQAQRNKFGKIFFLTKSEFNYLLHFFYTAKDFRHNMLLNTQALLCLTTSRTSTNALSFQKLDLRALFSSISGTVMFNLGSFTSH